MIIIKIKELTDIERLELALKYSISKKHKESLIKRIEDYGGKVSENKKDDANNNLDQIEQVGFF